MHIVYLSIVKAIHSIALQGQQQLPLNTYFKKGSELFRFLFFIVVNCIVKSIHSSSSVRRQVQQQLPELYRSQAPVRPRRGVNQKSIVSFDLKAKHIYIVIYRSLSPFK